MLVRRDSGSFEWLVGGDEPRAKGCEAVAGRWLRKHIGGQAVFDFGAWVMATLLAGFLRYEFDFESLDSSRFVVLGTSIGLAHWVVGKLLFLYGARYSTASFYELLSLGLVTTLSSMPAVTLTVIWGASWGIPRSTVLIAAPLFFISSGLVRLVRRLRKRYASTSVSEKRALVYGAGAMAEVLIPQLLADSSRKFWPVGLLDDDPEKANRWISGVKMQGAINDLPRAVRRLGAQVVIVAIPRANHELLQKVRTIAHPLGVDVVLLPSFSEILDSKGGELELRELGIEELVGRRAVSIDSATVGAYLSDRTVLITGAGGSIGVELCRQVAQYSPKRLVFLDRDETGLQHAQLAVTKTGLLDSADLFLADIRERSVIDDIFAEVRPEVVFHAAALKHLPALERFPHEAWKTNVVGTANLLAAAADVGVTNFVNISTDKAADSLSVLGHSKKLGEELTSWYSSKSRGVFHSVRFGNVLGSRGSLIPTLRYLIDIGGPVMITDPEATRFFMTIPEACQLVLQAGSETSRNSILILDMGEPVKIIDIAHRMIEMSGKNISIEFSGLRDGEKLHEDLTSLDEIAEESAHSMIWRVVSNELDPKNLEKLEKNFRD